jgi:peptidyl-prolyl cis-trans isomerase C
MPPAPRRAGRRGPAGPALALAALACLLCGCSADPGVLARVNRQPITVAQFNEVARANLQRLEGPADSAKARLLKDLVDRELLVQGALSQRLDQTPEFHAYRRVLEGQVLREALYQRLLSGPFPVSDAEVRALYDRRATATRARMIFTIDEAFARQAAGDLERGEDFVAVADRYNVGGMIPPGGDIGFLQPGSLLAPLDDIVRTGTVGRVYGPTAAGTEGWFIVRIEERRPQPQPPFEQNRAQLAEMLRQRKQRIAVTRVIDQLRVEHQVVVLPGAPQLLSGKLRPVPGDSPVPQRPPAPGPEDRRIVLAQHQGGTYTLGEAYDDLIGGVGGQIDFARIPTVERWIQSQTIERAALAEARRRRIGDEPEVKRRLRERLNNHLLDGYYQAQVVGRIRIETEDFRAAYERFRPLLVRLQSARVISVSVGDSAAAAALAAQAGQAPSLREAAATAAVGDRVSEETLTFPADSPLWTRFEDHLAAMSPGAIAGPFPIEDRWLIFQLREKQQDAPPFEQMPAEMLSQIQNMASEIKREERLLVLTDSLRRAFSPVVVYSDRLRRLPWPPAAAGNAPLGS